jgi:imidazolonepropionase-like amidohydrolase
MNRLPLVFSVLAVLMLPFFVAAELSGQDQRPIALTHAVIIDGSSGVPIESGTVIVRGEKIEAVGPAANVPIPEDSEVRDLAGKVVMPGLADMHVHLVGGWDGISSDMLGYHRYLNALLYSGVPC